MKKIVFFTQNLNFGGVQKSVSLLANYLKNHFDISIILAEDNKVIEYDIQDIKVYQIKTLVIDTLEEQIGEKLFNYRAKELDTLLHKIEPTLLISYEDYHNLIALSVTYECKRIISCRVSIKDTYDHKKIHLLDTSFYYKNINLLYNKADLIIAVSNSIKHELKNIFQVDNVITIYNGIETKKDTEKVSFSNFILNIGRLYEQKGQKDLIKAFYKIKNNINENLIIVGDGILRNDLEKFIKSLALEDRVFLTGFDEPYKYIQNCSLFVFPSYYEGFSNTILEVMSCKKNIIAYNYKGSDEILFKDNIVDLGNIDLLANKILFYLGNKSKNKLLEQKLFEKSKQFQLKATLKKYKKEIERLCVE